MYIGETSANTAQGAISYWIPIGREPAFDRGSRHVLRLLLYHCELNVTEFIWVHSQQLSCDCELRMSFAYPCSSSMLVSAPYTS
jgi:hypothetical protein